MQGMGEEAAEFKKRWVLDSWKEASKRQKKRGGGGRLVVLKWTMTQEVSDRYMGHQVDEWTHPLQILGYHFPND